MVSLLLRWLLQQRLLQEEPGDVHSTYPFLVGKRVRWVADPSFALTGINVEGGVLRDRAAGKVATAQTVDASDSTAKAILAQRAASQLTTVRAVPHTLSLTRRTAMIAGTQRKI